MPQTGFCKLCKKVIVATRSSKHTHLGIYVAPHWDRDKLCKTSFKSFKKNALVGREKIVVKIEEIGEPSYNL